MSVLSGAVEEKFLYIMGDLDNWVLPSIGPTWIAAPPGCNIRHTESGKHFILPRNQKEVFGNFLHFAVIFDIFR